MSVSVLITNTTALPLALDELYITLGAAGSSTDSTTITRSVAELDSMNALKTRMDAGDVTVVTTQSSDNVDLLSIPLEQHGVELDIDVNAITVISTGVVFPEPYPTGVVPVVMLTVDKTKGPASRSIAYAENITNVGFDIELDVTTADSGLTVDCGWVASY